MKKYAITLYRSTDLKHSGRIIMACSSLTKKKHSKCCERLYIRVGRMVVSTVLCPGANVLHTVRVILTALCLFPRYILAVPSARSRFILDTSLSVYIRLHGKKYMKMPLNNLCDCAVSSVELLSSSCRGGLLRIRSSRNVKDIMSNLMVSYIGLIQYYAMLRELSAPPTRGSRYHKLPKG